MQLIRTPSLCRRTREAAGSSARVLRDDPDAVEDVHAAYFDAGADVATTASYQASFEALGVAAREMFRQSRLASLPA